MPSKLAKQPKLHKDLEILTFEIEPTRMHRIVLGRFSTADPEPKFEVIYHSPDPEGSESVPYKDEPILNPDGTYLVVRHFQSFSQRAHKITVQFASTRDKALEVE